MAIGSPGTAQRWQVTLDRADAVFTLRDALRSHGIPADAEGPGVVRLETDKPRAELEQWLGSWMGANRVHARLDAVDALPLLLPPPPADAPPRLGELLVRKGFITEAQLAWALTESRSRSEMLGVVLVRSRMIFEDELARTLSEQLDIPYVSVGRIGVDRAIARMIPAEVGARAAAIPVRPSGDAVLVAFADPTDPGALDAVRTHLPRIDVAVGEISDIRLAWQQVGGRV